MGCDIHIWAEVRDKKTGTWTMVGEEFSLDDWTKEYRKKDKTEHPFDHRDYSVFAFFADVRNYDHCEPLSEPRGIPEDSDDWIINEYERWNGDAHSASYLTLRELSEFDYDKKFWNRRIEKQLSPNSWTGAGLAEEGEGKIISYRENFGKQYFTHLEELKQLGDPDDVRIVFFFDN